MPIAHVIPNGQTVTANMGGGYSGGIVSFQFFDAGGAPVIPVGVPRVFRTGSLVEVQVYQFARNEWRFNGVTPFVRIDLTGVTGFTSYKATVWRTEHDLAMTPEGAFTGLRAMTYQTYDEANKKNGSQWEASRLISIASNAPASNAYSIIRTGALPVDLKSRVFGYDELGVIGRIYKGPTYTGGTEDPWFNMNPRFQGTQPLAKLLTGFTLTNNGTKCGADIVGIGPASAQGRGSTPREFGSNRILDEPNTAYLLEIQSRNGTAQNVYARLEIYEGGLDSPLGL